MIPGLIWPMIWDTMHNVDQESDLYEPMRQWLQSVLEHKYKREKCRIITLDTSQYYLDSILEEYGVIEYFPQIVGLGIQIDVLGIAIWSDKAELTFIEAKKTSLTLRDLGQLWAYCKLCDPAEAYLLTSLDLGSLDKVLNNLSREDLLDFGVSKKQIKKMKVAHWDIVRNMVDYNTMVPKI